ncbi:hypothetical protein Dimus_001922 [Dionaea muscipula]
MAAEKGTLKDLSKAVSLTSEDPSFKSNQESTQGVRISSHVQPPQLSGYCSGVLDTSQRMTTRGRVLVNQRMIKFLGVFEKGLVRVDSQKIL